MTLIMFTKFLAGLDEDELIERAKRLGIDGYDLAVRPGYLVNPSNAGRELPRVARALQDAGVSVPMVTLPTDFTDPKSADAETVIAAMADAGVGLAKIGYFKIDPTTDSYEGRLRQVRSSLEEWEDLARKHGVKVCYHTHSNRCMGLNAGSLAHMLTDRDPRHMGAYLDTAHLAIEGEEFALAVAMVDRYLSIVSLKDVLLERKDRNGHGMVSRKIVTAGDGVVDWTAVFETLGRARFHGPLTIHCEFEVDPSEFEEATVREATFFRRLVPRTPQPGTP
jgi:sugar phosphate isomerase/epimerase